MAFLPKLLAKIFTVALVGLVAQKLVCHGVTAVNGDQAASTDPVLKWCNKMTYDANNPYVTSVEYVVNTLVAKIADHPGNYDLRIQSPYTDIQTAYGHATCDASMSVADCWSCIAVAYRMVYSVCIGSIGARAYLVGCSMRYENYSFTDK